MPPRLNKRQQRELEELEALGGGGSLPRKEEESSEDEAPEPSVRPGAGAFSTFLAPEGHDEDSDEGDEAAKPTKSRKSKKKKKTTATAELSNTRPETPTVKDTMKTSKSQIAAPLPKNEKKALKKARAKEKKIADNELDQALAELSVQYSSLQQPAHLSSPSLSGNSLPLLLVVSLPHLDAEAEMKKFFGAKVVQANKTSSPSSSAGRRQAAALRASGATSRSNLTRPKPTWWPAQQREGLVVRGLSEEELWDRAKRHGWDLSGEAAGEEKWWTVEYSQGYKRVTKAFMATVLSGDPQGFWDLLAKLPWHADALLQLSEVYRHREEHADAVDFVDRALFAYERAFVGAFNFTSGTNRLDFDYVENRPFFLAVHRQVIDLQRRGCTRTAFEFARLLYSLDPWDDPHGALFHLEFLAPKTGMGDWLVDVWEIFDKRGEKAKGKGRMDPSVLPGWAYARALVLKMEEERKGDTEHEASTAALKDAILSFPSVVPILADKIDVSLPVSIRGHRDFKIETDGSGLSVQTAALHLLSHLYVQRSFSLWKEHSAWFLSTALAAAPTSPAALPVPPRRQALLALYNSEGLRLSLYRHVLVIEGAFRRLFSFIPRSVLDAKSLACDPLPPVGRITEYNADFFHGVQEEQSVRRRRTRREQEMDQRRLAQMVPDAAFRRDLQGFFEAHPNLADRFPGGILQFAQMVGQLPPEVLEDMMLAEAMGGVEMENGGMPGQMPGMDMGMEEVFALPEVPRAPALPELVPEEESEEEEEDEDEEAVSPMPRVIRNILGRFFGRAAPAEDSSSDEDPVDDTGVD